MTQVRRALFPAAALLALGLSAVPASAATWAKNATTSVGTCGNAAPGTTCTIANAETDGSNATLTAWGNVATNSTGAVSNTSTSDGMAGYWRASNFTDQGASGLGLNHGQHCGSGTDASKCQDIQEGGNPEHAFDNNQRTDAGLFKFDKSTSLKQVTFGWSQTDLDFTVLAWTGNGVPSMSNYYVTNTNNNLIAGKQNMVSSVASSYTTNGPVNGGWKLVGNYAKGASSSSQSFDINALNVSSSYWLIMAYNSAFGSGTGLDMGNDTFKLFSVAGSTSVSEPGALALALMALGGVAYTRRRRA
jgi:MYXO-CTERM domain-containing protein